MTDQEQPQQKPSNPPDDSLGAGGFPERTDPPEAVGPAEQTPSWSVRLEAVLGKLVVWAGVLLLALILLNQNRTSSVVPPDHVESVLPQTLSPQAAVLAAALMFLSSWYLIAERRYILHPHHWLAERQPAPPWGLWECVKIIAGYIVCLHVLLIVATLATGGVPEPWRLLLDPAAQALAVLYLLLSLTLRRIPWSRLGLTLQNASVHVPTALKAFLALLIPYLGLALLNSGLVLFVRSQLGLEGPPPEQAPLRLLLDPALPSLARATLIAYAVVGAPLIEETFFRGLFYGGLRRHVPWTAAALISGTVFGLIHGWAFALPLACLGIYLAILREQTGGLLVPIVVHALFNATMLSLLMLSRL